ncbi:glycosyltransferase [Patescibacteria group bacterium]
MSLIKQFLPFLKYCVVGTSGTFVDFASLYVMVEYFGLNVYIGATLAFLLAVVNNFTFNKIWTFKNKDKALRKQFIKFLLVSCVGLCITLSFMFIYVNLIGIWYMLAKILTAPFVLTWNFLANKYWTFRANERNVEKREAFEYELSIVIPAFNEERQIKQTLNDVLAHAPEAEIICVNDGSTDGTLEILLEFKGIRVISYEKNQGKGYAVKQGMLSAKGKYVMFIDADNQIPIHQIDELLPRIREGMDVVVGSRYLPGSTNDDKQSLFRNILSRTGNFLIRLFLISDIKDSQCGIKMFEHNAAQQIFSRQKTKRFSFDMEVLVIAQSLGYSFVEIPIDWNRSTDSSLRAVRDSFKTLFDLFYIKLNLWCGRYE